MQILKRSCCVVLVAIMLFSMVISTTLTASAEPLLPHLVQLDAKWKNYYYGGANLYKTGCGIFSLSNSVAYLTGKRIDVPSAAKWAHSIGAFNVNGGDGTYRLVLYPKVQAKYGKEYGFTLNCNNGQGWWAGSSSSVLKKHLANGGVAIGHVPGHFIAIVDYNYDTNKFHVLDSAPSTARGTSSNRGDCWVTQARLATGKLKLDWFCLLSAVGTPADEQNNEKTLLATAIATAKDKRYDQYSATGVTALRSAYDTAVEVYNASSSTQDNYKTARIALENAMKGATTSIISTGKAYTTSAVSNPDGDQKDDGKKLTDGSKANSDGGTSSFVGFKGEAEIVVNLGSVQNSNIYKIYMTAGSWGVAVPYGDQLSMKISTSNDGTNFTEAVSANNSVRTGVKNGEWETVTLTAVLNEAISAQYIKFTINSTATNNYVWLDEVEVTNGEPLLSGNVYINGMNEKIGSGDCFIFTPKFGTITVDNANHAWTANIIAKWDDAQYAYKVTGKTFGEGATTPSVTLAHDEIMICANNWETGVTDGTAVVGSAANANTLFGAQIGDYIKLDGIDAYNSVMTAVSYAKISTALVTEPEKEEHIHTPGPESCDAPQICLTCNEKIAEAKGHDEGEWIEEAGMSILQCTRCGAELDSKELETKPDETPDNGDKDEDKDPAGDEDQKPNVDETPRTGLRGDIDNNEEIDSMDYILLKRYYFNTFDLDDEALLRADIDGNSGVDTMDYILLKRVYFNTFTIKNPVIQYK